MSKPAAPPPTDVHVLVTDRPGPIGDGGHVPIDQHHRMVFAVMTPFAQAVVRAIRTFLQGWVGFLLLALAGKPALAAVGIVVLPDDFLAALWSSAGLAMAPTVISLLQNLIEIFAKFDESFPKLRA